MCYCRINSCIGKEALGHMDNAYDYWYVSSQHFYNQYCSRVKKRVEEYDLQFQPFLQEQREYIKKVR